MQTSQKKLRIAALGDLHMHENAAGLYNNLFTEISQKADVLVICGDLTDHGFIEEAEVLANELAHCKIPIVGVLGNHDYTSDNQIEVAKILSKHMHLLENNPIEIEGVGFAGTKGFCGGFEKHMLAAFGEPSIKAFVQEAVNETLSLENQLVTLRTEKKVVVLHYSPTKTTLVGEPEEIFPFLGSSRLAEPLDNYEVDVVFHGHADLGSLKGFTAKKIPVYNVALPLLRRLTPEQLYLLVEV